MLLAQATGVKQAGSGGCRTGHLFSARLYEHKQVVCDTFMPDSEGLAVNSWRKGGLVGMAGERVAMLRRAVVEAVGRA